MRCRDCGLYYVALPAKDGFSGGDGNREAGAGQRSRIAAEMLRLSERARELALVEPQVEQSEGPWRELMARERLADLTRFVTNGQLLEIGCSTGEMLRVAQSSFTVFGVEADEANCRVAASRGLNCFNGALAEARFPNGHFDVAALYHVIEHFPSPRAELRELHRIVAPGGWLVIETPNIANFWFQLLGARWRQIIPDHLFFFTPETLRRLCEDAGFELCELRSVGKAMSARLFISRVGRYHRPTARLMAAISRGLKLEDRTLRLNFGDVMRLYARRR